MRSAIKLKKLHLGCGPKSIMKEWWNVDIRSFPGIDEEMDVTKEWKYIDCFEYIYGEHFIEHLNIQDAYQFLCYANKSLIADGKIRLSTPSLEWVVKTHFTFTDSDETSCNQTLKTNRAFHGWGHRFLYSKAFLELILRASGFCDITFFEYSQSKDPELTNIESHGGYSCSYGFPSVWIVEAKKGLTAKPDNKFLDLVYKEFVSHVNAGH